MSDAKKPRAPRKADAPKADDKALAPRQKETRKLTPAHVSAIIDMAANGYSLQATVDMLEREYGLKVHINTVLYHRRASREKLLIAISDEIALARANVPELATLTGRLAGLQSIIEKEKKKKRGSAYALTQAYASAASDMHHAQILALRMRESLAKYPEHKEGESERVLQELERRSHLMRDVTERTERIYKAAEEEFVASDPEKPVVVQGEVVDAEEVAEENDGGDPGMGAAERLGEDVLQG